MREFSLEYKGYHGAEARADIRIYGKVGQSSAPSQVVVMAQPVDDYEGLSVTNGAERIAKKLADAGLALVDRTIWIEHYPEEARGNDLGESWSWVTFSWFHNSRSPKPWEATRPNWHHLERAAVEAWIGGEYV